MSSSHIQKSFIWILRANEWSAVSSVHAVTTAGIGSSSTFESIGYHTLNADPVTPNVTGQKSFYADQNNIIRYASPGPASSGSPPI